MQISLVSVNARACHSLQTNLCSIGALYIDYEKLKERSVLTVTKSMENNVWIIMDAMSNTTCTSYGVFT